jgi:hypothetical protein
MTSHRRTVRSLVLAFVVVFGGGMSVGFGQATQDTPGCGPDQAQGGKPMAMGGMDMKGMPMKGMTVNGMASDQECKIVALKARLKITDVQEDNWDRFAAALLEAANAMSGSYEKMVQPDTKGTLPLRLTREAEMLAEHLSSVKVLREALDPLYRTLNEKQKEIIDSVLIGPMGLM